MCIWVYLKKNILTILCVKGIMEWEFTRFYSTTNKEERDGPHDGKQEKAGGACERSIENSRV